MVCAKMEHYLLKLHNGIHQVLPNVPYSYPIGGVWLLYRYPIAESELLYRCTIGATVKSGGFVGEKSELPRSYVGVTSELPRRIK
jgi:hypothetical protein